jgi:hypothetical protein
MPKKKQIGLTLVRDRVCSQHHAGGFSCDSLVGIRVVDCMTRVYLSSTRIKSGSVSSIINLNTEEVGSHAREVNSFYCDVYFFTSHSLFTMFSNSSSLLSYIILNDVIWLHNENKMYVNICIHQCI